MARQADKYEFYADSPGTGLRIPYTNVDASLILSKFVTIVVAPEATLEDLNVPDRAIRLATEHLARRYGINDARLASIFGRIVSQVLCGVPPKGEELLPLFLSGPLSWPTIVLASEGISDPLAMLEAEDLIALSGRLAVTDVLIDIRTPLYTRKQLGSLLADFAAHQEQNKKFLIATGHPLTAFPKAPWLDIWLNKLYPVKMPVIALNEPFINARGAFDPRYLEARRLAVPLSCQQRYRRATPSCPMLDSREVRNPAPELHPLWGRLVRSHFKESTYLEADLLPEVHEDDVEWLEKMRPSLHEVKVCMLAELAQVLKRGEATKIWDRVIRIVADRLNKAQVRRLLRLDEKYHTYNILADSGSLEPLPIMPGGLSAILEVAGHAEKEVVLGTLHRTREALGGLVTSDLVTRPMLRGIDQNANAYFVLASGEDGSRWRASLDIYQESEADESGFWLGFRQRLKESLRSDISRTNVKPPKLKDKKQIQRPEANQDLKSGGFDDGVSSQNTLQSLSKEPPTPSLPVINELRANVFQWDSGDWKICYGGAPIFVIKDSPGMHLIHQLLSCPKKELSVIELDAAQQARKLQKRGGRIGKQDAENAGLQIDGSRNDGEVLDEKGFEQVREELRCINDDLAKAERDSDFTMIEVIKGEIRELANALAAATTPNGKKIMLGDQGKKILDRVTKAIRRAIEAIGKKNRNLCQHLTHSVKTGFQCVYNPERTTKWDI